MQSPNKLTYISRKQNKDPETPKDTRYFTKISSTAKKQLEHSLSHSKLKLSPDSSPKTARDHYSRLHTVPSFLHSERTLKMELVTPRGDSSGVTSKHNPKQNSSGKAQDT